MMFFTIFLSNFLLSSYMTLTCPSIQYYAVLMVNILRSLFRIRLSSFKLFCHITIIYYAVLCPIFWHLTTHYSVIFRSSILHLPVQYSVILFSDIRLSFSPNLNLHVQYSAVFLFDILRSLRPSLAVPLSLHFVSLFPSSGPVFCRPSFMLN
jgi:hypothetical protein